MSIFFFGLTAHFSPLGHSGCLTVRERPGETEGAKASVGSLGPLPGLVPGLDRVAHPTLPVLFPPQKTVLAPAVNRRDLIGPGAPHGRGDGAGAPTTIPTVAPKNQPAQGVIRTKTEPTVTNVNPRKKRASAAIEEPIRTASHRRVGVDAAHNLKRVRGRSPAGGGVVSRVPERGGIPQRRPPCARSHRAERSPPMRTRIAAGVVVASLSIVSSHAQTNYLDGWSNPPERSSEGVRPWVDAAGGSWPEPDQPPAAAAVSVVDQLAVARFLAETGIDQDDYRTAAAGSRQRASTRPTSSGFPRAGTARTTPGARWR